MVQTSGQQKVIDVRKVRGIIGQADGVFIHRLNIGIVDNTGQRCERRIDVPRLNIGNRRLCVKGFSIMESHTLPQIKGSCVPSSLSSQSSAKTA